MAEALKVFFLAILQGVTEFLPVSSSGHLAICDKLLGLNSTGVRVEVMLHFGTLIAVVVFYWGKLLTIIRDILSGRREGWIATALIAVGCVPAVIAYLLFDDAIKSLFDASPSVIGLMLVITGAVLISLRFVKTGSKGKNGKISWFRAAVIGVAQAFALLPGISRSGSTIVAARWCGVSPKNAADYSFLISLPLLFGAAVMSVIHPDATGENEVGWGILIPAMMIAAVVGYFSIKFLMRVITGAKFWWFGIYCACAGLIMIIVSLV